MNYIYTQEKGYTLSENNKEKIVLINPTILLSKFIKWFLYIIVGGGSILVLFGIDDFGAEPFWFRFVTIFFGVLVIMFLHHQMLKRGIWIIKRSDGTIVVTIKKYNLLSPQRTYVFSAQKSILYVKQGFLSHEPLYRLFIKFSENNHDRIIELSPTYFNRMAKFSLFPLFALMRGFVSKKNIIKISQFLDLPYQIEKEKN